MIRDLAREAEGTDLGAELIVQRLAVPLLMDILANFHQAKVKDDPTPCPPGSWARSTWSRRR